MWAVRGRSSRCERYWDIPVGDGASLGLDEQDWIAETRRRLEESVEMQLISDVPPGVLLSGGVDSSAIAAMAQRGSSRPIQTFAVGYLQDKFSELELCATGGRSDRHATIARLSSDWTTSSVPCPS